jgi:hypothetical protein
LNQIKALKQKMSSFSSSHSSPNTSTVTSSWNDVVDVCQLHIFSYLCIQDILNFHRLDKHTHHLLSKENEFWMSLLVRNIIGIGHAFELQEEEFTYDGGRKGSRSVAHEQLRGRHNPHSEDELTDSGRTDKLRCQRLSNWLQSNQPVFLKTVEDARQLLRMILTTATSPEGIFLQLNTDVVEVSSMDRTVENPLNTLKRSPCLTRVQEYRQKSPHMPIGVVNRLGYLLQVQSCTCAGSSVHSTSCYWSSSPNRSQDLIEFITYSFGKKNQLSIIYGFSLTPYQAFFQPEAPTYAPMRVKLQILAPMNVNQSGTSMFESFPRKINVSMDQDGAHYRHSCFTIHEHEGPSAYNSASVTSALESDNNTRPTIDLSNKENLKRKEQVQTFLQEQIAYESESFFITHSSETQYFTMEKPLLCLGGYVRLVFEGAHQRQNLQEWGFPANADDFFVCLSNVEIFGLSMRDYKYVCTETRSVQVPETVSANNAPPLMTSSSVNNEGEEKDSNEKCEVSLKSFEEDMQQSKGKSSHDYHQPTWKGDEYKMKTKEVSIWKILKKTPEELVGLHTHGHGNTSDHTVSSASFKSTTRGLTERDRSDMHNNKDASFYEDVEDQFVNFRFTPTRDGRVFPFRWPRFEDIS